MTHAVVWRTQYLTELLVNQIRAGLHSPGRWRILDLLNNMQAFAQAFNCKPGGAMAAGDPIVAW